jgi:hypothetical protein
VPASPDVRPTAGESSRVLVIGCGALARELVEVARRPGFEHLDVTCLPARLHNRPALIAGAVERKIRAARPRYPTIFVAYADCGTGGELDRVLAAEGVERLAGAHCYEVYAGREAFARLTDDDPATFFLTDFLARHFESLVIAGLGIDRHPELLPMYFGNYRRLVYLAQTDDPELTARARSAADRLGLAFERRAAGLGELGEVLAALAEATAEPTAEPSAATPASASPAPTTTTAPYAGAA